MDNCNSQGGVAAATNTKDDSSAQDIDSYNYMNPVQKQQIGKPDIHKPVGNNMGAAAPSLPSMDEIARYATMNIEQKQRQQQQIEQSCKEVFPGTMQPQTNGSPAITEQQPAGGGLLAPITPTTQPQSINADSLQYMNGFLRTQIGRPVKVDFLIGTNTLLDKAGILLGVGVNYILIVEAETDDIVACDFYNIKFIKFYY